MANVIDILVTKQAQSELDKVIASLKVTHEEIIKINQQGLKINSGASPKNPQQMNSSVKESIALNERLEATNKKILVTAKQLEQASIRESNARNALNKQRETTLNQLAKEQQRLEASENLYNKIQAKINALSGEYKNLSARKELGISLTDKEAKRYEFLQSKIQTYDKTLKAVDATMGKYTRNVGNYAGGFNPLNNSINQLGREMPAFANSVQTGFMAISNNLPIFFDAMGNVIAQNKELQAQGQPTKSVLSQLAGALFSFQTLLSVGVTLLTLYGKEIVNWVGGLWGASEALDELNKNQKEFNNARFQGKKDAQSDIIELKKYLAVYNDVSLSAQDREIAYKKLSQQYAYYIKNVSDATMVNGKYSEGVNKLLVDLEKQKALEKETSLQVTNKQKLLDLEKELSSLVKLEKIKKKELDSQNKIVQSAGVNRANRLEQLKAEDAYNSVLNKRIKIDKDIDAYQKAINKNEIEIIKLTKERIGLEYQDKDANDKKAKSIKGLDLELQDYISSQYALLRLQKEMNVESNKQIFDDENQTLSNRLTAYERYVSGKTELEIDAFNEEKRLLTLSYNNELSSLKDRYNDYIKQENVTANQRISAKKELDRAILALDKKTKADFGILEQQHSINILEITKKFYDDQRKLRSLYFNLSENKKFQEMELRDLQQHQLRLANITKDTSKQRIDEIDKLNEDAQKEASRKRLQLRVDEIVKELDIVDLSTEKELKLKTELYLKLKEISNLESADLEKKKQEQIAYLQLLEQTYSKFFNDFASQSGFSGFIDIFAGGLDKFKGDAVATALVVSEAFQEAFNTMSQMSDANYQQMFSNLERQRDVSILFAGESATAREEIDRQYEERRKRIQRQQAESQKKLALFNIAINTAQGITSALAMLPPNVPLAVTIGIIGAAQLAMTASQPIPQFYKGTQNAPEGLAWTDEKGAELHTDSKGNIKDYGSSKGARLKKLDKGDKIYTASQTKKMMDLYGFNQDFNNIMLTNGINTSNFNNNSVNLEPLNARLDRLTSVVANKSEVTIVNNESGTRYYERVNGQRRELVNSVLTMKSRTIK